MDSLATQNEVVLHTKFPDRLLYSVVAGSRMYGTHTENSDVDIRGIFVPELSFLLNPFKETDYISDSTHDIQFYGLNKFVRLLANANPNILELLWAPKDCVINAHPLMEDTLLKHRDRFLTKKIKDSYCGYAHSQLGRIQGHSKWINNPQPKDPPALRSYVKLHAPDKSCNSITQEELYPILGGSIAAKANAHVYKLFKRSDGSKEPSFLSSDEQINPCFVDMSLERLEREAPKFLGLATINLELYQHDLKLWKDYWSWKTNRNKERALTEEVNGYDGKHAMHLLRLLRQCKEIFSTGEVHVRRPDAEELLKVRRGEVPYNKIIEEANQLKEDIETLYKVSALPEEIDLELLAAEYYDIITSIK